MSIAFPTIAWAKGTNIYEVNVRQYTPSGTLKAFAEHLPRLRDMGVDIIWLMPVTPISIEGRQGTFGSYYAASSYTQIDPFYGTEDDFRDVITKAHDLGLKVIIDWVANHTGYDHEWTVKFPHYYIKDEQGQFTRRHEWMDVIDLDYDNPELRTEMINSMKHWIMKYDIDGFRQDMARTVPLDFWLDARGECDTVKPLFWLGECEVLKYHEVFDLIYGWELMRAIDKYFKKEQSFDVVREVIVKYMHSPAGSGKLLFSSNHDENTYWGTEYEKYGSSALALAVFTCTFPGTPLVYSGQELPNKERLSFFEKDCIKWTGTFELNDFYRTLLMLRKKNPALHDGASILLIRAEQGELIYLCRNSIHSVLVILNLRDEAAEITLDHPAVSGEYYDVFGTGVIKINRRKQFQLDSGGYVLLSSNPA
ncbi:MAG: 1,4-alpha-glucan branching protein [Chitinophagaceae bacterium]|nr:MAG: 1,4-alpha-glucan branching protein [Chitinophagaceae bacterium]